MKRDDAIKAAIAAGGVAVRVGGDMMECPKGRRVPLIPVIQLIWAQGMREIPAGRVNLVWTDKEGSSKPGKTGKYLSIIAEKSAIQVGGEWKGKWDTKDLYTPWVSYKCPKADRESFKRLHDKWGCFFLVVGEGSLSGKSIAFLVFKDGTPWPGSMYFELDKYTNNSAAVIKDTILEAWGKAYQDLKNNPVVSGQLGDVAALKDTLLRIPDVLEELGGKLPWTRNNLPHWGVPDKKMHDEIVFVYITTMKGLLKEAEDSPQYRSEFLYQHGLMRKAKVFEVAPESFMELCRETLAQLDERFDVGLTDKVELFNEETLTEAAQDRLARLHSRLDKAIHSLEFPDHLPFDVCWFGLGEGLPPLTQIGVEARNLDVKTEYNILGYLITNRGEVHELLVFQRPDGYGGVQIVSYHFDPTTLAGEATGIIGWKYPRTTMPWVLCAMIDAVNQHQNTILELRRTTPHTAGMFKRARHELGVRKPTPPPFYTVYMRDSVIRDAVRERAQVPRAQPGHRFDRRGSYIHRIQRGPLPMDPEVERKLLRVKAKDGSRYRIFKGHMPSKWKKVLRKRHLPTKQPGEWVAILRSWRSETVCGPKDAPYIPSTRKATKGPLADKKKDRRHALDSTRTDDGLYAQ